MEQNKIADLYEEMYSRPTKGQGVVQESVNAGSDDSDDSTAKFKKSRSKRKRSGRSRELDGAIEQVNSSYEFDNVFTTMLKEMEEFDSEETFGGGDDNVFDADGSGIGDDDLDVAGGGDAESVLQSIYDQLKDYFEGGASDGFDDGLEDEGDDFDFEGDLDEGDDIPEESYGFNGGEGNPKGAQGNYDGRARKQAKSTHVKDNGDVKFDQQKTGYDPEPTGDGEASEHGAQGNYDGKARTQGKTNLVKGNGDADFGKAKTGMKTSTGKDGKKYF